MKPIINKYDVITVKSVYDIKFGLLNIIGEDSVFDKEL